MSANLEGRFCVRCKWHQAEYVEENGLKYGHLCAKFAATEIDPVTGGQVNVGILQCSESRAWGGSCGPSGAFFDPKDSALTD